MKIVADNKIPFLKGVFEPYAEVVCLPGGKITAEVLKDADALITRTRTKCTRELLEGSSVKVIATATIGFDHIDTAAVEKLGIVWRNAPGCNANSVAQYICGTILSRFPSVAGMTLGVVGVGHVGSIVARYAEALGMTVLRNDPPRADKGEKGFVPLAEILERSDIVTMHVPLEHCGNYATFHMADEKFFRSMKRGSMFINASRGEVTDTAAVKKALAEKLIAEACFDVWENEPEIDLELLGSLRIGTMHIAGYSTDGKANGTAASVQTVAEVLNIPQLKTWRPAFIPPPEQPLEIEYRSVAQCVLHTYDPRVDTAKLQHAPDSFEELRGSYPIRREFFCFTVKNAPDSVKPVLKELGFRLA